MALLLFFAAFALAAVTHAVGQPGFLSIDCGLEANYGGYKDTDYGIIYVSDGPYVDAGENHRVAAGQETGRVRADLTVRSFLPGLLRNCYSLPTIAGSKYLVRVVSFYGNYDGKISASTTLQFDLHLGANYWDTVRADGDEVYEAVFVAWASWAPVCLVNTGQGTPFVSSVELRPLGNLYPEVMGNQSMRMSIRRSMGPTTSHVTRFPQDQHDRFWWAMPANPMWANLSTTLDIEEESKCFQVPSAILQKAVTAAGNGTMLNVTWEDDALRQFMVFLHLADFQNNKVREFDVYFNSDDPYATSPDFLAADYVYSTSWTRSTDGKVNIALAATAKSVLPPILNAFEIYTPIAQGTPTTFSYDFDAIMAIKIDYGIKKNWMGDPCFPTQYSWEGVKCRNTSDNIPRIISIDLSSSSLYGAISSNFTLLTALEYLNLTGNQLNGPIPDSLCKMNTGSFVFSYEADRGKCNNTTSSSRNRAAILAASVAAPVLVLVSLLIAFLIWRVKRKPNISANNHPREPEHKNPPPGSEEYHWNNMQNTENRRFTYEELEKFTDNFQHLIGEGGFGPVYHGRLEDNTEVAVKKRSETSKHGFNEFLAEVQSLTKVHHKNLVSLVGYCLEGPHLALVYEYMSGGNLSNHLRGVGETLSWTMRVRVLLDAAQGLDYLHKGCKRSIIHRDVKTSNILLGQNLQAKIADFGLSKTYFSESQTHMTVPAAGSLGYIDPEYQQTGWITEGCDVYSFGVVLLEVVTGKFPIVQGHGHIIQLVKQKVASGDISSIADERLGDHYVVSSMWKVVEIALLCTEPLAAQRPSMATVVAQLKESLVLEEAPENGGLKLYPSGDAVAMLSTFNPSAR